MREFFEEISPDPIGSVDSADAEREKRSQRLESGTRRFNEK